VHPVSTRIGPRLTTASGSSQVVPRHPQGVAYRCFLPDLTGFTDLRCAGPDSRRRRTVMVNERFEPRPGIQLRCSGLRIQGTASSPPSTTGGDGMVRSRSIRGTRGSCARSAGIAHDPDEGLVQRTHRRAWREVPREMTHARERERCRPTTAQCVPVRTLCRMRTGASTTRSRCGGEGGIRTHVGLPRTAFPVPRPRPLGDLSADGRVRGGEGGIRTLGTVTRTPLFESGTLNHSDTSPRRHESSARFRPNQEDR
jgi:hypothetical protein